jgi:hypothetical protein
MEVCMKSRSKYQEEEMKETRRGTKFTPKQIIKAFVMIKQGKKLEEISKITGISIGRLSEFRKEWRRIDFNFS